MLRFHLLLPLLLLMTCLSAVAQPLGVAAQPAAGLESLPRDQVIAKVPTLANPQQQYSL